MSPLNLNNEEDNFGSLHRCISLCRKGADILNTTVRELDAQIGRRRRVGALKAVLKKPFIDRLRERIRNAQFMLYAFSSGLFGVSYSLLG
jgi:hypothetical protein